MDSPLARDVDEVRREIIDTVRRFVAREVIPVASELEHEDEYPTEIVGRCGRSGCSA